MTEAQFRNSFLASTRPSLYRISSSTESSKELRALQYFDERIVPSLSPIFDVQLWSTSIKAHVRSIPTVRHLLVGISALYEQLASPGLLSTLRGQNRVSLLDDDTFALQHYVKALQLIQGTIGSKHPSLLILKISSVLCSMFELLRENRSAAIVHTSNAIRLLESTKTPTSASSDDEEIDQVIQRLSLSQSLCGRPRSSSLPLLRDTAKLSIEKQIFSNIKEARISGERIIRSVHRLMQLAKPLAHSRHHETFIPETELSERLAQWSSKLQTLETSTTDCAQRRVCKYLRAQHLLTYIFFMTHASESETSFDPYVYLFREIVDLLAEFLNSSNVPFNIPFSLDTGIVPSLYYTALKCRDPEIRRKAIALLKRSPRRDGPWDALEAALSAELVVQFEEQISSVSRAPVTMLEIPEGKRVHELQLMELEPGNPQKQLVILRYKPLYEHVEKRMFIDWSAGVPL